METYWCRDDMQFNTETSKMDMAQWKEGKEQLFYHCCVVSRQLDTEMQIKPGTPNLLVQHLNHWSNRI